ncbi:MAG: radical SAM protein [Chitinophagia bacterium]|nr:radical SAM protein [Chitinophagia bacterium]
MFNHKIKLLDIENSTICNARCPQCTRQGLGEDTSWFEHSYLPTEVFTGDHIPEDVWQTAERISFEGTMGDPCAAPNLIQSINAIRQRSKSVNIKITTNGGLKNPEFWRRLARALGRLDKLVFAIDGLEDTNHIYRVGVDWTKLMTNVKAFISEGGNAEWQFIVFRHNQHQTDAATELAKVLGFKNIYFRKTSRFIYEKMFKSYTRNDLKPPTDDRWLHPIMKTPISMSPDQLLEATAGCGIKCYSAVNEQLFIDFKGRLFPCCFTAGDIYMYEHFKINDKWNRIWQEYGGDRISILHNKWHEIVSGDFYKEIAASWGAITPEDSLFVCNSNCSTEKIKTNEPLEFRNIPIINLSK